MVAHTGAMAAVAHVTCGAFRKAHNSCGLHSARAALQWYLQQLEIMLHIDWRVSALSLV
jgi:hypothetical protein